MRSPITHPLLAISIIVSACGGADASPRFIARSEWHAPLKCVGIPQLSGLSAVADVNTMGDSAFLVLLGDERKLVMYDAGFRQIGSLQFDKDGPRGVLRAVSAVVTDTMVFIADDARSSIRYFTRGGADAGTARLTFIPRRLRMSAGELVVTPLVAGSSPAHLAFVMRARRAVPLGGRIARYDEVGVHTLANMTSVAAFDDRVLVMHEMVVPFGYVMRPRSGADSTRRFSVPVPADVEERLGRAPRDPLTERNVQQLAVVAFTAAPVHASGAAYYVTRTSVARGRYQKLLVRLDSLLNVEAVFPIAVSPQHMVFIPARGSVIVVDSESDWYECKVS